MAKEQAQTPAMEAFDISSMAATTVGTVKLKNPKTGDFLTGPAGTPLTVTVDSPGTLAFAEAESIAENRAVEKMRQKGKGAAPETAEEKIRNRAEFLAAVTRSLDGFSYKGGNDKKAFLAMYSDLQMGWLYKQVDRYLDDWANFMTDSPSA